jgi:hypothetical protein
MEKNVKVYVSKIIEEDGNIVMIFQPDLFKKLKLEPGSLWQWEPQEDESIKLTKVGEV